MRARLHFWRTALLQAIPIAAKGLAFAGLLAGLTLLAFVAWLRDLHLAWALVLLFVIVLGLLAEGSYRIWSKTDEQLTEATAEHRFPDCEIETSRSFYLDRERDGRRFLFFPVRVTNRETVRRVSLHVEFGLDMFLTRKEELGRSFYHSFLPAHEMPENTRLPDPLEVEPQSTREGDYVADGSLSMSLVFDEETEGFVTAPERDELVARVRDHVTGQMVQLPVRGVWTRDQGSLPNGCDTASFSAQ